MERIIREDDEKIRKAKEIYYRRNNQNVNLEKNIQKNKSNIKDKFFLHLLIMFDIAILIFCIQNKEYIFTEEFINRITEFNTNISYNITSFIKEMIKKDEIHSEISNEANEANIEENNINNENNISQEQEVEEIIEENTR